MKRKYLLLVLLVALALFLVVIPQPRSPTLTLIDSALTDSALIDSTLVDSALKETIEVSSLQISDYTFLSKEQNEVFFTKEGDYKQVYFHQRPLRSIELSPTQKQAAFLYHPDETSYENASLVIFDTQTGTFEEVYHTFNSFWDVTSDLHWLGNNYIIFLRHCGTACQGITLLDIRSGKTENGVLTYPSFPDQPAKTHFKDWFGEEFVMNGLVENVSSETKDDLNYLIFKLKDYEGDFLGEHKFQFVETETAKILQPNAIGK